MRQRHLLLVCMAVVSVFVGSGCQFLCTLLPGGPWCITEGGAKFEIFVKNDYTGDQNGCQEPDLDLNWKLQYKDDSGIQRSDDSSASYGDTDSDDVDDAAETNGFISSVVVLVDLSCTPGLHSWYSVDLSGKIPAGGSATVTVGAYGKVTYSIGGGTGSSQAHVIEPILGPEATAALGAAGRFITGPIEPIPDPNVPPTTPAEPSPSIATAAAAPVSNTAVRTETSKPTPERSAPKRR